MGHKNREIEAKMLAIGVKGLHTMIDRISTVVATIQKDADVIIGNATDLYWAAPVPDLADFVRLRKNAGGAQLTMKGTDKGDNIDRVEIDLEVDDYKQAKELMVALHGEPMAAVTKKYRVFFLENHDTNISVYQVKDDDRVFVEIEARNRRRLRQLISLVLSHSETEYLWVKSSIYNIFVQKTEMAAESTALLLGSLE